MIHFKKLDGLIHTNRWNGKYLICSESVSDHVWCMNALAMEFIELLPSALKSEVDLKELIYRITMHDIGESLYCDIPRDFKYFTEEFGKYVNKVEAELVEKEYPSFSKAIDTAKDKTDKHGFLVSVFDSIQAGLKMRSEILLGNRFFESEILNSIRLMDYYLGLVSNSGSLWSSDMKSFLVSYLNSYKNYLKNLNNE